MARPAEPRRSLLPHARERWPDLSAAIDDAEDSVVRCAALADEWRATRLPAAIPLTARGDSLSARLVVYTVLNLERGVDVAAGAVRGIDADRVFSAGLCVRALLELAAQASWVAHQVRSALAAKQVNLRRLDRVTSEALVGVSGDIGDVRRPAAQPVAKLLRRGEVAFGPAYAEDYRVLSALAHPTGSLFWRDDPDGASRSSISPENAERLLRGLSQGLAYLSEPSQELMDLAERTDLTLP